MLVDNSSRTYRFVGKIDKMLKSFISKFVVEDVQLHYKSWHRIPLEHKKVTYPEIEVSTQYFLYVKFFILFKYFYTD